MGNGSSGLLLVGKKRGNFASLVKWVSHATCHMGFAFDQSESTWVYDYVEKTAELYTTDRRLWLRAIARNPNFVQAQDLTPGYRAVWPLAHVRTADMVVAPKPGGIEVSKQFMTVEEVTLREATGERLRAAQREKGENGPKG
jgi:hypothetical protein